MTTYLALARLTVGADERTHHRELLEGLERVLYEMSDHGFSLDDIERECESITDQIRWDKE